jgi:DNA-directed RNA polymerase alpha subunit
MIICDFCRNLNKEAKEYEINIVDIQNESVVKKKKVHYCKDCISICFNEINIEGGTNILSIKWDYRITNIFLREGITTVEKLLSLTTKNLLDFKNFGITSLAIVNEKLQEAGFPRIKDE